MLGLLEILQARHIPLTKYKIHLATSKRNSPLDSFYQGDFKQWQETQNARNFECEQILSLISLDNYLWLFAGVYRVLKVDKGADASYTYQTALLPNQDDLIGRIIVKFKRKFRASYIWGDRYGHVLEIAEIKAEPVSVREFPGYDNTIVPFCELRLIVKRQEPNWKYALENVYGVYLISDKSNGKLYVGSAYGEGGIWSRWECYALTGHGNNKELGALIEIHGLQYAENFRYSILEIFDYRAAPDIIIERENYWKDALLSALHGYNE